jgi:hypothetical protein
MGAAKVKVVLLHYNLSLITSLDLCVNVNANMGLVKPSQLTEK